MRFHFLGWIVCYTLLASVDRDLDTASLASGPGITKRESDCG